MRTEQRADSNYQVARRKWLWWQYVGMGIFLATWPGVMMIAMFDVPLRADWFVVLMVTIALVVFAIGTVGKQELKEDQK